MNKIIASIFISGMLVLCPAQLKSETTDAIVLDEEVALVMADGVEAEQSDAEITATTSVTKAYMKPAVVFVISACLILMIAKIKSASANSDSIFQKINAQLNALVPFGGSSFDSVGDFCFDAGMQ